MAGFCDQDPEMREAFAIAGQGRIPQVTLDPWTRLRPTRTLSICTFRSTSGLSAFALQNSRS